MRSIIIASIVAVALATSSGLKRNLEPKTEYHYKLDGHVLSGLPTSSEFSQSHISARARIQAVDDRYIALQLVNIGIAASHLPESDQMPAFTSMEKREVSEDHKQILELPVRCQLKNGLISELQFDQQDSEWSKNIKRAVLNLISFNPVAPINELEMLDYSLDVSEQYGENSTFFTNEKTLEGDCQVAYTVVREHKKIYITKSVNFDKCTDRSEIAYGLHYYSKCPECDRKAALIRPQTVYTYVLENGELKESEVRSLYVMNVNGQEVMKTESRSKLVLEENHSIKSHIKKVNGEKEDIIYSSRWEQLVEDFYKNGDKAEFDPFEKLQLDKKIKWITSILEQVQEDENNMPEATHFLARLVRIFRTCTMDQLQKLHETLYVKSDRKIQSLIERVLSIAGTKNTIQHLLVHIEDDEITQLDAVLLLKSIQDTPYPSKSIVESLIKLAHSRVAMDNSAIRQSAWLAAGSVVYRIVGERKIPALVREDRLEIKQKFLQVFMQQYKRAGTTYEKILALKTIGNAGLDISVNQLNDIIVDNEQPVPVRKEAIDALRLLKDSMPRKIQKVLLPIYKNRQYPPEIRIRALRELLYTHPEEHLLVQVVSQMAKESNQQVATLTYKILNQFAQSTNPCYQQVSNQCSKVLSFARFKELEEKRTASAYAQLPLFHQDSYSGAQLDIAAIFEKSSALPKDLQASLDTIFGGNWIKNLAQVGFSQQHLDQYIWKVLQKLESLEKDAVNVVRARRVRTGINLLKNIAQKMNIRARPTVSNENDVFALAYLRYMNMDYALLPIDSELIDMLVERFVSNGKVLFSEVRRILSQNHEFEAHHATFFYEAVRQFPTTIGVPLTITGKIPSVASIEGQFSLELKETEFSLTVEARPSVAVTHVYEMRMHTPLIEQGVKSLQSARAFTPLKIQAVAGMKRNFEVVYKVVVPEKQKWVVSLTTRPVVFLRYPGFYMYENVETEERTVVVPQWQKMMQEVEKVYNLFGLDVYLRGNVLNQHSVDNWLLAEQDFEVSLENGNRPAEFAARITVSQLEKTELSQIKMDTIFEDEIENEQEATKNRHEHFNKMIKNIQKELGYKNVIAFILEAPRDFTMNTELTTICDKQIRMCKCELQIRRSPVFEESKEWTLRSELLVVRPEMPSSLNQLKKQLHREVQLSLTSSWGSQRKNEITVNAELQQSMEQKKYERTVERQLNGIPEYELLIKAARLNKIYAVADYKFSQDTEQVISRYFDLFKAYNYWTVLIRPESNKKNRVVMQLTVEPLSRKRVNVTLYTSAERIDLKNVIIPQVHLPSIAKRSVRHQFGKSTRFTCNVQRNQIRTFDNVLYKAPLTTCYSLIAKDCSEMPTFAVFTKKVQRNDKQLAIKVVRGEQEITAQLLHDEIRVMVDGKNVKSNDYAEYQIEQLGESLIVIWLPEGEVRFDGYTTETQLPSYSQMTQLCGLCGNNDDETNNEFYTADNTETEDIEEFHRSYLLKNEDCEVEEERLSEKKNYKMFAKNEEEPDDSSYEELYDYDREYSKSSRKSPKNSQLVQKTQVKEFPHRVCFSIEPVAECRHRYYPEQQHQRKIPFTCLPRHSSEARRLMNAARHELLQLDDYETSFVKAMNVPTACVAH